MEATLISRVAWTTKPLAPQTKPPDELAGTSSNAPLSILIVDPEPQSLRECVQGFATRGWRVEVAQTFLDALRTMEGPAFDLVIIDVALADMPGTEAWTCIKKMHPDIVGIMTTSSPSLHRAINATGEGASDYLLKPLDARHLSVYIQKLIERRQEHNQIIRLQQRLTGMLNLFSTITFSTSLDQVLEKTLAHLRGFVRYDLALLNVTSPDGKQHIQQHTYNPSLHITLPTHEQSEFIKALAKRSADLLQPVAIERTYPVPASEKNRPEENELGSCVVVPLIGQKSIYGTLAVINTSREEQDTEPARVEMLVALCQVVAIALDREFLAEEFRQLRQKLPSNSVTDSRQKLLTEPEAPSG
jgi:DNA-binding response OmpR family regulator